MVQLPSRTASQELMLDGSSAVADYSALSDSGVTEESPDWDILGEEWLSDEPELESDFHREQITVLLRLMQWYWRNRDDIYCSGNTTVYFDESQRTNRNFKGPDVFVLLGVDPSLRNSWMAWREGGRYPNVVIELLSDSTAHRDRTEKKALYQNVWRLPEYFWFHPRTLEFRGFRLMGGQYQELQRNERGYLWSEELVVFLGMSGERLRLFTPEGDLIALEEEEERLQKEQAQAQVEQERLRVQQERFRAEQERLEKEQAQQLVERLARRLRELGVEPDGV